MNVVRSDPSTKSLNKNVESYFVLLANEILRMKISPKKHRQHYQINHADDFDSYCSLQQKMNVEVRNLYDFRKSNTSVFSFILF